MLHDNDDALSPSRPIARDTMIPMNVLARGSVTSISSALDASVNVGRMDDGFGAVNDTYGSPPHGSAPLFTIPSFMDAGDGRMRNISMSSVGGHALLNSPSLNMAMQLDTPSGSPANMSVLGRRMSLAVDVFPYLEPDADGLSLFATPSHTAAAAIVVSGVFDRQHGSYDDGLNDDAVGVAVGTVAGAGAGAGGGTDADRRRRRKDQLMSRDILIGEALPVVRLSHLAAFPPFSVCVVDVRNCARSEHEAFAELVRAREPGVRLLHCPGNMVRLPVLGAGDGDASGGVSVVAGEDPDERVLIDATTLLSHYDATGGLDVELLNKTADGVVGTEVCKRAIESSLRLRRYKRFAGLSTTSEHVLWLRRHIPTLESCRGMCIALYGGTTGSGLVLYRNLLLRAAFPNVCGLSLSFMVGASRVSSAVAAPQS
jgi:hypothetical protein